MITSIKEIRWSVSVFHSNDSFVDRKQSKKVLVYLQMNAISYHEHFQFHFSYALLIDHIDLSQGLIQWEFVDIDKIQPMLSVGRVYQ